MKLVHLVGFIIKKFVTMHGHINVIIKTHIYMGMYAHMHMMFVFPVLRLAQTATLPL